MVRLIQIHSVSQPVNPCAEDGDSRNVPTVTEFREELPRYPRDRMAVTQRSNSTKTWQYYFAGTSFVLGGRAQRGKKTRDRDDL